MQSGAYALPHVPTYDNAMLPLALSLALSPLFFSWGHIGWVCKQSLVTELLDRKGVSA